MGRMSKSNPNDKKLNTKITKLVDFLNQTRKNEGKGLCLSDIFPTYQIPTNIMKLFRYTGMYQSNLQMIQINTMMKYLRDKNFYGDQYNKFRKTQIIANQAWIEHFYPSSKQISKALPECAKLMELTMGEYETRASAFPHVVE